MCFAILSIKSPCGRIATIESKLIRLLISLSIDLATPGYWTFTATLINTRDTRDRFSYRGYWTFTATLKNTRDTKDRFSYRGYWILLFSS